MNESITPPTDLTVERIVRRLDKAPRNEYFAAFSNQLILAVIARVYGHSPARLFRVLDTELSGQVIDQVYQRRQAKFDEAIMRLLVWAEAEGLIPEGDCEAIMRLRAPAEGDCPTEAGETDPPALVSLVEAFAADLDLEGKSPDTINNYRYKALRFARWLDKGADEITEKDIKDFIAFKRRTDGISDTSTFTYLNSLKAFCRWLQRTGYLSDDPFANIKLKAPEYPIRRFLTVEQVQALLVACRSPRETLIIGLGVFAGLRSIETYRLTQDDIRDDYLLINGKGGTQRLVPLAPALKRMIEACLDWAGPVDGRIVGITRGHVRNVVIKVAKRAGVRASSHILRHSFATHSLRLSDLETVRQLLGHKDIATTAIYVHSDPGHLKAVVARLPFGNQDL